MLDPTAGRLPQLAAGLLLGLGAALACLWLWPGRRARPPMAGLGLAAATVAGLGLTGAAGGGPAQPALGWPGLALATAAVAAALAAFDRRWGRLGLLPLLLALSAAGIWATVPDTEAALVLLGAALAMALLGRPGPLAGRRPGLASFGVAGSLAVAAVLVWVVATGGAGRPGSVVGGLACLGLLAVEPAARGLDPRRRSPLDPLERRPGLAWAAAAAQLVLVAVASRVVGRPDAAATALGLAALELGAALAAGVALARRWSPSRRTAS
jgi:hypothetical protein